MAKRVAILTYNGNSLFELGCAVELFALPRPDLDNWYQCQVVSFEDQLINSTAGLQFNNIKQITSFSGFDLLIIPSWFVDLDIQPDYSATLVKQLICFAKQGGQIAAFCSGAFLLAQTGLINYSNATTHWRYAEIFKTQFPEVNYVDNVLYCFDGKIATSAGSAAALDLGLAIIRSDYHYKIANQVARRLVVASHRNGGQAQFVETPVAVNNNNSFSNTLDWALSHLDQAISVEQLAQKACMSRRTFDRKFKLNFNTSANRWITEQRLHLAKQLLEDTKLTIEQIANKSGFDNATTMRHHFRKLLGISPVEYRQQFQLITG